MGFLIPLLAACTIENNVERCPDNGCLQAEPEAVPSDSGPMNLPDLSGCDFAALALPVAEDESDSFDNACPLHYQGEYAGAYDAECVDSLDSRAEAITAAIPDYFADEAPIMDILTCKVPLTVFYEYRPTLAGASDTADDSDIRTVTASLYVTIGDRSEFISDFDNGALADPMPFPNLFVSSSLDYADAQTVSASSITHGIADADAVALVSETNVMDFADGEGVQSLLVNDLDYATPCDGCDYTLVTSGSTLAGFGEDLTGMVAALFQIRDGETETKRGGAYFPPED